MAAGLAVWVVVGVALAGGLAGCEAANAAPVTGPAQASGVVKPHAGQGRMLDGLNDALGKLNGGDPQGARTELQGLLQFQQHFDSGLMPGPALDAGKALETFIQTAITDLPQAPGDAKTAINAAVVNASGPPPGHVAQACSHELALCRKLLHELRH